MPNRRDLLALAGGLAAGLAASPLLLPARSVAAALPAPALPHGGRVVAVDLTAAERPFALPAFGGRTLPLWTFSAASPPPVLRLGLGDRLKVTLTNALPRKGEHVSIHWHGIRLPIAEDGVPMSRRRRSSPVSPSLTISRRPTPAPFSSTRTAIPPSSWRAA